MRRSAPRRDHRSPARRTGGLVTDHPLIADRGAAARGSQRRSRSRRLAATAALAVTAGMAWAGAVPAVAMPRSFPAMSDGAYPGAIAAGADGNLWFTEHLGNRIGRITPRGAVDRVPVGPERAYGPAGIAAGSDGNLWFTDSAPAERIGRITPTGPSPEFSRRHQRQGRPPRHHRRPRRQPLVHRVRREPDRPHHHRRRRHRVLRRHHRERAPARSPPAPTATCGSPSRASATPDRAHHPDRRR